MTETGVKINCRAEPCEMMLIGESELLSLTDCTVAQNVVVEIRQQKNARYQIVLDVAWKEEELCLGTTRKTPRNFASLDTLVGYLKRFNHISSITLKLYDSENKA
jgi:hypothetical protein